jgi:hypothetical protein
MSVPAPIDALRKKHAISDVGGKNSSVRSTVGIVFEATSVAMVVPGGPAFKPSKEGKRIEKGDTLKSIDGKDVTPSNLIPLLRGSDVVGSLVKIEVQKADSAVMATFNLSRSDIRAVEKMKDLYMKLAELQAEARAPRQEKVEAIARALESQIVVVTDWASLVEESLRAHNDDLEKLVAEYMAKYTQAEEQGKGFELEAASARKELSAAQDEHDRAKEESEARAKSATALQAQLHGEIASLQSELDKLRQSSFEDLKAERERAAKELQELRDRMQKELEDAGSLSTKAQSERLEAERTRHEVNRCARPTFQNIIGSYLLPFCPH